MSSKYLPKIHELFNKIQKRKPLSMGEKNELQKSLLVEFTYNSNAIEGNTLTRSETKIILEDGLTIGGKTIKEIDEAKNHKQCFKYLEKFLEKKQKIKEEDILKLHSFILQSIDEENAGKYRSVQVYISGDRELPPKASEIKNEIQQFFKWYNSVEKNMDPVLLAAKFHYKLVKIHPFIDGNGRLVRLCINLILMQKGFPMIIIPNIRRAEYIKSLNSENNYSDFEEFFADIVLVNLQDYWRMIG